MSEELESHDDNAASSPAPEVEVAATTETETSVAEKTDEPKKPDRFQTRINQLTTKNHEAEQRNAELEARLKALEAKPVVEESSLVAPNPDEFDTDQDYQAANAKYYAEVAGRAADARVNANNEAEALKAQQQQRQDSIQAKKASFDAKVESKRDNFSDFEDIAYGHNFMDMDLAEQIFEMDKGPEVAYHLGSNLDEAARIFALSERERARELTKLEYQVEALTPKRVSDAPDPIKPLGNSETIDNVGENGENITDADEWQKWRNRQIYG
jgi:hypothetical protein